MVTIKKIRIDKKLTQSDLAIATGISQANISRYETGERKLDLQTALKIANVLGCKVDDLIDK